MTMTTYPHPNRSRRCLAAIGAAFVLVLAACGEDNPKDAPASSETSVAPPTTSGQEAFPEAVTTVLDALENLATEHTDPEESDPGMSGAQETYDLDIGGFSAGINLFDNTDDLDTWVSASNDFDGIAVTVDTTAVSLNSDEGRDESITLAPRLAEELGGVAHTGEESDDMASNEQAAVPADEEFDYQCPQTGQYVSDSDQCEDIHPAHDGVPIPDGGTCPAYLCGYGHDAEGNPNPSSGEIQGRDGCQQGYIDDPEYCAAIEEVFEANNDWE